MLEFLGKLVEKTLDYVDSKMDDVQTKKSSYTPSFYYDGNEFYYFEDIVVNAINLGRININKAKDFFRAYINWIYNVNDKVLTMREAEHIAYSNFKRRAWQENIEVYGILMEIISDYE